MTHSTRNMVRASLFAGAMAVCAWLAVPISDIGFTMQTFGVFLALGLLGGKWGTVSIGLYLMLGLVGLSVFAGFRGGAAAFLDPTGGFLWGFLLGALVYWLLEKLGKLPAMVAALLVSYLCGSWWFSVYAGVGLIPAMGVCVLPWLIPDGCKLALAWYMAKRIGKHLKY